MTGVRIVAIGIVTSSLALAACTPPIELFEPGWKDPHTGAAWKGPTVQILTNHITCELLNDYNARASDALWNRLSSDNFVASIDLSLMVTHAEGLNGSLSFITPLDGAGNVISNVIKVPVTVAGTTTPVTSTTFNRTLALGGQLTGTQDDTLDIEYVVDFRKLVSDADTLKPLCGADPRGALIFSDGLEGDLALDATINDGLNALDTTSTYNIYGTTGPTNAQDTSVNTPEGALADLFNSAGLSPDSTLRGAIGKPPAGGGGGGGGSGGGGGGGGGGGNSGSSTLFSAKIDFDVAEGANGGPNWTVLTFKGPSGGGGGGGGGAGGGGSGGGGSSGGGGGQLLSFTRSTADSLSISFTPTCRSNQEVTFEGALNPAVVPGMATAAGMVLALSGQNLQIADQFKTLAQLIDVDVATITKNQNAILSTAGEIKTLADTRLAAAMLELTMAQQKSLADDAAKIITAATETSMDAGTIKQAATDIVSRLQNPKPGSQAAVVLAAAQKILAAAGTASPNASDILNASRQILELAQRTPVGELIAADAKTVSSAAAEIIAAATSPIAAAAPIRMILAESAIEEVLPDDMGNVLNEIPGELHIQLPSMPNPAGGFPGTVKADTSAPPAYATITRDGTTRFAAIAWSGNSFPPGTPGPGTMTAIFNLAGSLTPLTSSSGATAKALGTISVAGYQRADGTQTAKVTVTADALDALFDDGGTKSYWDTISNCDALTSDKLDGIVGNAIANTRYLKLTGAF